MPLHCFMNICIFNPPTVKLHTKIMGKAFEVELPMTFIKHLGNRMHCCSFHQTVTAGSLAGIR